MKIETSFERLKKGILELKDGYPEFVYWGKIEFFVKTGKGAVDLLENHGIIEKLSRNSITLRILHMSPEELEKLPKGEDKYNWYRLTAKGVDLAISMINLDYSETMKKLTLAIFVLGALNLLLIFNQFVFPILF